MRQRSVMEWVSGQGLGARRGALVTCRARKGDPRNLPVFCWGDPALDWRRWLAEAEGAGR